MDEQRDTRLLIAEDEANLRLVLQKELQRLGYRVQVAPCGVFMNGRIRPK